MSRLPKPTYANVMSTIAVFLCLGMGTAWASSHLSKNSVKPRHVAPKAIKARHLSDAVVKTRAIGNASVTQSKLARNSVGTPQIAGGAVGTGQIGGGAVTRPKLAPALRNELDTSAASGKLALHQTYANQTVSNTAWPTPASGQVTISWNQPANTIDRLTIRGRVVFTPGCTAHTPGESGIELKAVHAEDSNRVISADTATATHDGNGFLPADAAKPGVMLQAPYSGGGNQRADYMYIPMELADFYTTGSSATRTVRLLLRKRGCSGNGASIAASNPQLNNIRAFVTRYK